jgi:hypothetical protein
MNIFLQINHGTAKLVVDCLEFQMTVFRIVPAFLLSVHTLGRIV